MEIARGTEGTYRQGEDDRFTGTVWLRTTVADDAGTNLGVVTFGPGARTHWHRHPGGQFLFGLAGRGRVRTRGERGHVLEPGDVVRVGAEEWHFHGGTPESPMTHVAVNGGGAPQWGDPVTDEEYAESF